MIKLGMINQAINHHTLAFSRLLNGADDAKLEEDATIGMKGISMPDVRIVSVYCADQDDAKELAAARYIDHVAMSIEEMYESDLDGVLVVTENDAMDHGQNALGFLERGIPTYIDKPLAPTVEKLDKIVNLARRKNGFLMSCSALRYARELEEFQSNRDEVGEITLAVGVSAVGKILHYGIHPLELIHTVMGWGVEYVHNVGDEGNNLVKIAYPDGRRIVLLVVEDIGYTLEGTFYGRKGQRLVKVEDSGYFYSNTLKNFVEGIIEKRSPVALEDTLEIVKICLAAEESLKTGERVYLNR